MKLKRLSVGIFTLLVFASCGKKEDNKANAEPPFYESAVISLQDVELQDVYPVTIKGKEDIEIRPRIDGFIDHIYVDEGSIVKAKQRLFKINSPSAQQSLTSAEASVNSAQANLNTAELNVNRFRPLAEKGIVSKVQLDTYVNAYESAKAQLEQAKAQLQNAKATMGWTEVTSPVDGVVGTIPYRQGSLVNSTNVLTTVANISNVFAYFSLNEKKLTEFLDKFEGKTQAEKIKNSPLLTLVLADGSIYSEKGKLETISGSINISTGTANFRAEFPNPHGNLRSGTSGNIIIPRHLNQSILIPQKATFAQQNKTLVYKIESDSVVSKVINVLSTPDGKGYVVTNGLSEGDRIVTSGVATLHNGMKITTK